MAEILGPSTLLSQEAIAPAIKSCEELMGSGNTKVEKILKSILNSILSPSVKKFDYGRENLLEV